MRFLMNTKPTAVLRRAHFLSVILGPLKNEQGLWSLGPLWASWSWVILNSCNTQTNPQVKSKISARLLVLWRDLASNSCPGSAGIPHLGTTHLLRRGCSPVTKQRAWADLSYWICTEVSRCNTKNKTWLHLQPSPCWQLCQPMTASLCGPISSALPGKCGSQCVILANCAPSDAASFPGEGKFSYACIKYSPVELLCSQ